MLSHGACFSVKTDTVSFARIVDTEEAGRGHKTQC